MTSQQHTGSRRRSIEVSVGAVGAVAMAIALSGCSSGPDYQGTCVDKLTQKRVADSHCNPGGSGGAGGGAGGTGGKSYGWWYTPRGEKAPAVGQKVDLTKGGGSFTAPKSGNVVRGGFSAKGGSVGG
ncbi:MULTISPECIES: hypothetical protein [unclassified Streptomyces]|uniref:hypothetical protein n=1 Tax=unclassified Streptomyces TaxID=2593676 RepID=UPI000C27BA58|nr:hypothetical protein [Streptomyces sp. CB01373]PJM94035.1 hypothetical protein CG719_21445 [Streptomyces sp. CB01373]